MGVGKDIRSGFHSFVTGVRLIGDLAKTVRSVRKTISAEEGPLGLGALPAVKGFVSDVEDLPARFRNR